MEEFGHHFILEVKWINYLDAEHRLDYIPFRGKLRALQNQAASFLCNMVPCRFHSLIPK
jgi:hypothetical protein